MHNLLLPILQKKQEEVAVLHQQVAADKQHVLVKILQGEIVIPRSANFSLALARGDFIKVIAEVKRRSPSLGALAEIPNPVLLAEQYCQGNASAISVLTDQYGFNGSLADLQQVKAALGSKIPVLRKDFLIDPLQIAEAIYCGADAVLLIAAVLGDRLAGMLQVADELAIDALIEVHDARELDAAMKAGAKIIGINNRDLNTFQVDNRRALILGAGIPEPITKIAESGIAEPGLAKEYYAAGFSAVLVGETLVKSGNPAAWIKSCQT